MRRRSTSPSWRRCKRLALSLKRRPLTAAPARIRSPCLAWRCGRRREGEVIALHQHPVGRRAVEQLACAFAPPSAPSMSNTGCQSGWRTNSAGWLVVSPSTRTDSLPDATVNAVWPGVWPEAAIEAMPARAPRREESASRPSRCRRRCAARCGKSRVDRRAPRSAALVHPESPFRLPAPLISALGNTSSSSLVLMPLIWSGWKCEIRIVSICFRIDAGGGEIGTQRAGR